MRLLWLPNLFLSLKEVPSTAQESGTVFEGHLETQERNIRMHFFVCAGSREVWATLATHCRLPDTHVCCENWVSRPGRLVLFLLPVCPCLQEGALRRIQGPLTTFLFHSGISGSERAAASRHTHTHTHLSRSAAPHSRLQVLEMNEWASEWTWITIPWLYNLCHFPSCCTWKFFVLYLRLQLHYASILPGVHEPWMEAYLFHANSLSFSKVQGLLHICLPAFWH